MPSVQTRPPKSLFRPTSALSNGCVVRGWWKESVGLFQDSGGTVPVTADTDPVAYIADQSGNGNHWTQSTLASRLAYRTGIQFGRAMLLADGLDDHLICDTLAPYLTGADAAFSFLAVIRPSSTSSTSQAIFGAGRSSATQPTITLEKNTSGLRSIRRDDTNTQLIVTGQTGQLVTTAARVVAFVSTGTTLLTQVLGFPAETQPQDVGAATLDRVTLGALRRNVIGSYYGGYLGEHLFIQGALVARERKLLMQYLKGRWNTL